MATKTNNPPRCQTCKTNEAIYAMQYIGEDTPTFTTLGYHYRGYKVVKVCDECCEKIKTQDSNWAIG